MVSSSTESIVFTKVNKQKEGMLEVRKDMQQHYKPKKQTKFNLKIANNHNSKYIIKILYS